MLKLPKIPRNYPPEWEQGLVKTANSMGIMTVELSAAAQAFVEFSKNVKKPVLDIGAAYGAATYSVLENGANVVAIDLEQKHLDLLQANIPKEYKNKLTTYCASFPDGIQFAENSFSAILAAQIFHFFDGPVLMTALRKCYHYLEPGGKLFILVITPYASFYEKYVSTFNKRIEDGDEWPGTCNPRELAPEDWKLQLPDFIHLFDKQIIERACLDANFKINECEYFCYKIFPINTALMVENLLV